MNNSEYQRLIMLQYSLKLIELALNNNSILYYRSKECRDIVWDCQCSLMEWGTARLDKNAREEFYNNDDLALSFSKQLLWIGASAVQMKEFNFQHLCLDNINTIVLM